MYGQMTAGSFMYIGPQGIVHGKWVACPLHDWKINLDSGDAVAPDVGCAASFPVKLEGDTVLLSLKPEEGCPNK